MVVSYSAAFHPTAKHPHLAGEVCPWCEQPIPREKFTEISNRIAARERERFAELTDRLKDQFAQEKAQTDAKAKTELAKIRKDAATAIGRLKADMLTRETAARNQGKKAAESAMRNALAEAERAKKTAEQVGSNLKTQLEQARKNGAAAIERLRQQAAEKETAAREEGKKAVEKTMLAKLTEMERARRAAEQQAQTLKAGQETALNKRLQEQREALGKAQTAAVNAERSKAFQDKQKLQNKVQELQRQLDNKTTHELGEGAEIDLFEKLRSAFEDDRIKRVAKGAPGADIIHEIVYNGKVCGKIVYDSKNRGVWKNEYVTKLREDQIAANADHAILSSNKFPAGVHQLHLQEGVIVAGPARILALAELLRGHIVQTHELRASNEEREQKTAALYAFITSERCKQLLASIEAQAGKMLELEVAEQTTHRSTWEKRGKLIKAVLKVHGDLRFEIDRIIGTAEGAE
jgi:hypothetical protein